jgi:hypothetical protein
MTTISVDYSSTSSVHEVNQTIDERHWDVVPYLEKGYREFISSCQPWLEIIEPPLDFIP